MPGQGKPGKGRQGRQYQPKELTEKQQLFITNLTDIKSDTFANIVKSMQAAGFKHGRSPEATAIRLLANRYVLKGLIEHTGKIRECSLIRAESAKERIWQELESALAECKPREKQLTDGKVEIIPGDMTNRIKVIELMGKFHQLWSDKVTISVETYEKMSEEHMQELLELSKARHLRSGNVIEVQLNTPQSPIMDDNSGPAGNTDQQPIVNPGPLQACSGLLLPDPNELLGPQDVAGDSDDKGHNSGIIDKSIDDNDLKIQ